MSEKQVNHPFSQELHKHEPPVERPDGKGRIIVFAVEHEIFTSDLRLVPFIQGPALEKEISNAFGKHPEILIADSAVPLSSLSADFWQKTQADIENYRKARKTNPAPALPFFKWTLSYAEESSARLVLGDPKGWCPSLDAPLKIEDQEFQQRQEETVKPYQEAQKALEKDFPYQGLVTLQNIAKGLMGLGGIAAALGFLNTLSLIKEDRQDNIPDYMEMDKRGFIRWLIGLGAVGLTSGFTVDQIAGRSTSQLQTDFLKQKKLSPLNPITQINEETDRLYKSLRQPGILSAADYQSAAFKRRAQFIVDLMPITFAFRNAITAEIACLPVEILRPGVSSQGVDTAICFGNDHLIVTPEKASISYMISHPEIRQKVIADGLKIIKKYGDKSISDREYFEKSPTGGVRKVFTYKGFLDEISQGTIGYKTDNLLAGSQKDIENYEIPTTSLAGIIEANR